MTAPADGAWWWTWQPSLAGWARGYTGLDDRLCRVYAVVDGDRLRIQHGDNPEAVRWFSLDQLNDAGGRHDATGAVERWFDEIHRGAPAGVSEIDEA